MKDANVAITLLEKRPEKNQALHCFDYWNNKSEFPLDK